MFYFFYVQIMEAWVQFLVAALKFCSVSQNFNLEVNSKISTSKSLENTVFSRYNAVHLPWPHSFTDFFLKFCMLFLKKNKKKIITAHCVLHAVDHCQTISTSHIFLFYFILGLGGLWQK